MKKIKCNGKVFSVSNEALAAAYCGAWCNGHMAKIWIKKDGEFKGDFNFLYRRNIKRMRSVAKELPSNLTLVSVLKNAPANIWSDHRN